MLNIRCRRHGSDHPDVLCPNREGPIINLEAGELKAPCGHCGGHGACATNGADMGGVNCDDPQLVCPHCKGAQRGPDAPEPCMECDGKGVVPMFVTRDMAIDAGDIEMQGQEIATAACQACLGTGVQP